MPKSTQYPFRFFRAGGVDQVQIETADDLAHLKELDQKLWVALSCPVKGLEFDERTLAFLDSDGDGHVRVPELLSAIDWTLSLLAERKSLEAASPALSLGAIRTTTDEGRSIMETATRILKALGKPDEKKISIDDLSAQSAAMAKEPDNGDGIVPASALSKEPDQKILSEILCTLASPQLDRCGAPGVTLDELTSFRNELASCLAYHRQGREEALLPLGDESPEVLAEYARLRPKLVDYFLRVQAVAFDPSAGPALSSAGGEAWSAKILDVSSDTLRDRPLSAITERRELSLVHGTNPAYAKALSQFRNRIVAPLLGQRDTLSEDDFLKIEARASAHLDWAAKRPTGPVFELGVARLLEIERSGALDRIQAAIEADVAALPKFQTIEKLEKLVYFHRDLMALANNFVSFRDFYSRKTPGIFQTGTLYLDQRSADLCISVIDAGRHASLTHLSGAYLVYCDLRRAPGRTRAIACAITDGDVDNIMVGRNGIFYDRSGNDWDATVTRIVENPISIAQAFWSPYKKVVRIIEEQIQKRASQAAAEADAKVTTQSGQLEAVTRGETKDIATPPKKLDIGVVAALGVAVGGITAALGAILDAFFGLGMWMPLGVLGLLFLISGPSMAVAWLKLKKRNLGPLLDANGWAINVQARVNVPLGKSLTQVAHLPPGAARNLVDPFAVKKRPLGLYLAVLTLIAALGLWYLGYLDFYLPESLTSIEVLGEAAPALLWRSESGVPSAS